MPDRQDALQEKARTLAKHHGGLGVCSCGSSEWNFIPGHLQLPSLDADTGGYPIVAFHCNKCAQMRIFAANALGVF